MSGQMQTSQLKSVPPTHNTYLAHIWSWHNQTRWPSHFWMLKYIYNTDGQQWTALYIRMKHTNTPVFNASVLWYAAYPTASDIHSLRTIAKLILLNKNYTFLSSFFAPHFQPFLPTQCRCKGLLFHLITPNDTYTHTFGTIPLDEGSAHRRDLYLKTHTTLTRDRHPCPRRDSNPQSQQASGQPLLTLVNTFTLTNAPSHKSSRS
jgi:hypothetical protein